MDLNEYQMAAKKTAIYPKAGQRTGDGINYTILGLNGEAGEVADAWKKGIRDSDITGAREKIRYEIGDVLWYIANLASEVGMTLEDVAQANIEKLADRKVRGKLKGSGDNR